MRSSFLRFTRQANQHHLLPLLFLCLTAASQNACQSTSDQSVEMTTSSKTDKKSTAFSTQQTTRQMALFHMSDMESELVDLQNTQTWKRELKRGGVARLHTILNSLRQRTELPSLTVSGGDTFMPSPMLHLEVNGKNAVVEAMNHLQLQASAIGNHEFDLGEEFLAEFIQNMTFPFLSASLDIKGGPLLPLTVPKHKLNANNTWLERHPGKILPRGKVCVGGKLRQTQNGTRYCDKGLTVGLIGATTERLRQLSRLSEHIHIPDSLEGVAKGVQTQADALKAEGVDIVVLLSHLQGIHRELRLLDFGLTGIDIVVAGGGDNKLADQSDRLLPGDSADPLCLILDGECYPMIRTNKNNEPVLFVSTDGQMHYLGQLMVGFDAKGILTGFQISKSRPWPVDEISIMELGAQVAPPLYALRQNILDILEPKSTPFAQVDFFLDGTRESIRNRETNLGNLSADSMVWSARQSFPQKKIAMALRNGGGVRAPIGTVDAKTENLVGGPIRPIDIESAFRFNGEIVVVDTTHRVLVENFESALRGAGSSQGRFPQVSKGVNLTYSTRAPEQTHLLSNGKIRKLLCPGYRVVNLTITPPGDKPIRIVYDGKLLTPDEKISFATLEYLAKGGDGYFPTRERSIQTHLVKKDNLPIGEQTALMDFIQHEVAEGRWENGKAYPRRDPARPETFRRIHAVKDPVLLSTKQKQRCDQSLE